MPTTTGDRLTRTQEAAISALLAAPTIGAAASVAGVCPKTLRNWLKLPGFASAYEKARRELLAGAVGKLQHAIYAAADAMVKDLTHRDAVVRRAAAELLLNGMLRGTELANLAARVAAVEEQLSGGH